MWKTTSVLHSSSLFSIVRESRATGVSRKLVGAFGDRIDVEERRRKGEVLSRVPLVASAKLDSVGGGRKVPFSWNIMMHSSLIGVKHQLFFPVKSIKTGIPVWWIAKNARKTGVEWSLFRGSRIMLRPQVERICSNPKGFSVCSLVSSQIASTAFTWGTVAVLPFYVLMVFAPKATLTKRLMESNIPYGALGVLYGYLLYLSWTPETLRVIFSTKYLLPELPGMTKMFANEMTMASAWIHLLAVDLYAARQVFHDGMKNNVETRHSVTLCLLFCPIGILAHAITKVINWLASGRQELSVK